MVAHCDETGTPLVLHMFSIGATLRVPLPGAGIALVLQGYYTDDVVLQYWYCDGRGFDLALALRSRIALVPPWHCRCTILVRTSIALVVHCSCAVTVLAL